MNLYIRNVVPSKKMGFAIFSNVGMKTLSFFTRAPLLSESFDFSLKMNATKGSDDKNGGEGKIWQILPLILKCVAPRGPTMTQPRSRVLSHDHHGHSDIIRKKFK